MDFISFSGLIIRARTSTTILTTCDKNNILLLLLILEENIQNIYIKYDGNSAFFMDGLYQVKEVCFYF